MPQDDLLALDDFVLWLNGLLKAHPAFDCNADFQSELNLDLFDLEMVVQGFDQLTSGDAAIDLDIYRCLGSVRSLYLYYLRVMSMPREQS